MKNIFALFAMVTVTNSPYFYRLLITAVDSSVDCKMEVKKTKQQHPNSVILLLNSKFQLAISIPQEV